MNYHLYHHDDLDGAASGAVMLEFLKTRGEDYEAIHPLDYSAELTTEIWENMKFEKPVMIFDFQYHPDADWWIDHHASGFRKQEWQEQYRNDAQHYWDPKAPSGCGLVAKFLHERHGLEITPVIAELTRQLDIDDSMTYPTPDDAVEVETPLKQIQLILNDPKLEKHDPAYFAFREHLVRNLGSKTMEEVIANSGHAERISERQKTMREIHREYQASVVREGKNLFLDATDMSDTSGSRAAPFAKYPDAQYLIFIYGREGNYKVRAFRNNWASLRGKIDLGALARSIDSNGGGHEGVGALNTADKGTAFDYAKRMLEYVNIH